MYQCRPEYELYDLKQDPAELTNLASLNQATAHGKKHKYASHCTIFE